MRLGGFPARPYGVFFGSLQRGSASDFQQLQVSAKPFICPFLTPLTPACLVAPTGT